MPFGENTSEKIESTAREIVDAAFQVHSAMGPGLLESAYQACMLHELTTRGLRVLKQVVLPVVYDGVELDAGFRLDLLVEDCVIVEIKSVDKLDRIFDAQVLTYLKLTGLRLGILINFNVELIKNGIRRIIH